MNPLLLLSLLLSLLVPSFADVLVNTKMGPISGLRTPLGNRAFIGIKYADAKRWEWSTPISPWTIPIEATNPDTFPSCPQVCQLPKETCAQPQYITEDCLALNIFTPANPVGSRLPVLIWFHGGRYQQGYGGGDLYWGEEMALNAIVVSVNYRLGVLGYLYNEEMGIKGNFGLKDQILALEFIRHIIADFGGDPNKITISGQSAGAGSVAAILAAPSTHGMYQNAILFSNPFTIPMRDTTSQKVFSEAFMRNATCTTRECLDNLPLSQIYTSQNAAVSDPLCILNGMIHMFLPYTPTVGSPDGLLPIQPLDAFRTGQIPQDIGIIFGTTSNEAPMFIYGALENPVKQDAYKLFLLGILGAARHDKVIAKFPGSDQEGFDHRPLLVNVANEYIFEHVNNYLSLATLAARTKQEDKYKIYNYRYTHIFSDPTIWDHLSNLCGNQPCHAAELPILFRNPRIYSRIHFSLDEMRFTNEVRKQLTNFLWTGNPNTGPSQALPWSSYYSGKSRMFWEVDQFTMIEPDIEKQAFWDDVGYL